MLWCRSWTLAVRDDGALVAVLVCSTPRMQATLTRRIILEDNRSRCHRIYCVQRARSLNGLRRRCSGIEMGFAKGSCERDGRGMPSAGSRDDADPATARLADLSPIYSKQQATNTRASDAYRILLLLLLLSRILQDLVGSSYHS